MRPALPRPASSPRLPSARRRRPGAARIALFIPLFGALVAIAPGACGGASSSSADPAAAAAENAPERRAIESMLDAWHEAAAHAEEARYFSHFAPYAVFLGTDATERWTVPEFRVYARPRFARGKAWTMRARRRGITLVREAGIAWFDEELETEKLGPARGTGVVVKDESGAWKIAQYSLALTIPNARFDAVRAALEGADGAAP